ncbi:hypothetical protein SAMN05421688_1135 [Poseidonocella pacifica]|uniref:Uncharacterized protein n=1 Tax=Poseidonocella pacifica TaxID=871651 RepID=A0A1I0W9B4_9RHOB|nr:hypothetical protein [Poseidonocella pacifica]SFA84927.1 hypothetical protein SAMN05421688_1135 [Poseidonocella pacifica]
MSRFMMLFATALLLDGCIASSPSMAPPVAGVMPETSRFNLRPSAEDTMADWPLLTALIEVPEEWTPSDTADLPTRLLTDDARLQ